MKVTAEALASAREEGAALSAGLEQASALIEVRTVGVRVGRCCPLTWSSLTNNS